MKIALYIGDLSVENGGAFMYSQAVVKMLSQEPAIEKMFLLVSEHKNSFTAHSDFIGHPQIDVVRLRENFFSRFLNQLSKLSFDIFDVKGNQFKFFGKLAELINPLNDVIDRLNVDVIHVPFQVSPVYGLKTPLVVSMHDVQELHFPEFFSSQTRLYRALYHKRALEYSDHVIVSFAHIKDDLMACFQLASSKISVCPIPLTGEWHDSNKSLSIDGLKNKYDLPDMFMLYPAQTWKHKNHLRLLQAIKLLQEKNTFVNLVCTGGLNEYYKELQLAMESLQIRDQVQFLNIVSEDDLVGLYQLARLVVIPTLYEAGSAPLFEAMRYRIPVVCSNVTSLPESIGNTEFVFNPMDISAIADKIWYGCFDEGFRQRNIENSEQRLLYFRTFNYSSRFVDAYQKAMVQKQSIGKSSEHVNGIL